MELVEAIAEALGEVEELELAVVFGSRSRSGPRPGSDLDLAVLLARPTPESLRQLELVVADAVRCPVDLVDLTVAPPLLRFEVARDGVRVVEGRPHAWADFRRRAMRDWWDWAPAARRINAAAVERLERGVGRGAD